MTGWDILYNIMKNFPPIAAMAFLLTTGIIFAIGFFRHGLNFIRYGFKQIALDSSIEKRFDELGARIDVLVARIGSMEKRIDSMEKRIDSMENRLDSMENRLELIETNHFGHLKNYLGILNGVLLDKNIIDNETKARLDNEVRGM